MWNEGMRLVGEFNYDDKDRRGGPEFGEDLKKPELEEDQHLPELQLEIVPISPPRHEKTVPQNVGDDAWQPPSAPSKGDTDIDDAIEKAMKEIGNTWRRTPGVC